jgi:hypothetical protein
MHSRLLSTFSRILLAGCAVGIGASSMYGQSSTPAAPAAPTEAPVSRVDVFTGYSYLAPKGTVETPRPDQPGGYYYGRFSSVEYGAVGSVSYFLNRYVGGQVEVGEHTDGQNDGFMTYQGGLVFRYPTGQGITPFVHGLAGAVRGGGPNDEPYAYHVYTWGPALTIGGGMDYDLPWFGHHLGLRLFQADYEYFHINYGPQDYTGGRANPGVARISSGLVFKFGNIVPPPPVAYTCSATPSAVFPGDPVTITGTATMLNPKKTASYSWSGQGMTLSATTSTATLPTTSMAPGTYTVTGHVTEGAKAGESADCTTTFTVKPFEPPTVSCVANPSSVNPGDSSTITATGVSPQNRPLTYSYQASAGSISGTSTTATLATTGAPAGTITVTCNVADDKGQTASGTTSVTVNAPPAPAAKTQTLCSIQFDHDKRRPARVDNDAKGCLDDVALNAQRSTDASLVVVGNAAPAPPMRKGRHMHHEENMANLAAQRAVNTKDYLVKEKGIDASRISVRTGTAGTNEVENYLVPAGATFDSDVQGTTAVDETSMMAQPRSALATRHHHAHAHHRKAAAAPAPAP